MANQGVPHLFAHGSKLSEKIAKSRKRGDDSLDQLWQVYEDWKQQSLAVPTRDRKGISALVDHLNTYKSRAEPILDKRDNSAQEVLVSSILEEFMEHLFAQIDELAGEYATVRQPAKAYLELTFHPRNLESLVATPEYTVRTKDHDFVIGGAATLTVLSTASQKSSPTPIVIPAVAVECKRYLERNMLDECAGTAERVKRATPYCLYVVVSEYLKMDDGSPELTAIDEVFVLRKQRNSARNAKGFIPNPICDQLVWELYELVTSHLRKIWWDPRSALTTGRLFNR